MGKKRYNKKGKLKRKYYEKELTRLQEELVKLQYWIKDQGLKVCVIFEGRDAAGKGGVIKLYQSFAEFDPLRRFNPRSYRIASSSGGYRVRTAADYQPNLGSGQIRNESTG